VRQRLAIPEWQSQLSAWLAVTGSDCATNSRRGIGANRSDTKADLIATGESLGGSSESSDVARETSRRGIYLPISPVRSVGGGGKSGAEAVLVAAEAVDDLAAPSESA